MLLLVGAAAVLRLRRGPDGPETWKSSSPGAPRPADPLPVGSADRAGAGPFLDGRSSLPEGLDRFKAFRGRAERIRSSTAEELRQVILARGGLVALAQIRERLLKPTEGLESGVRKAILARLIPFVAAQDPSAGPAALSLSAELLQAAGLDNWARFQVLCGLGGVPSMYMTVGGLPDGPMVYAFLTGDRVDSQAGPYEASLGEALRSNPAILAMVTGVLASDPSFQSRAVASRLLGEWGGPEAGAAIARSVLSDGSDQVRGSGLEALARLKSPEFLALVQKVVLQDPSPGVHSTALANLPAAVPFDAPVRDFLIGCLTTGKPEGALPALAGAAFDYLSAGKAQELQPGLTAFFVHHASEAEVVEGFAERAVERGMTQFLPVFQALVSTLPADSDSREALDRSIRQLQEAPRYVALAKRIREESEAVRLLWVEVNRPGVPPSRREELVEKIGAMTVDLWKLQDELKD